MTAATRSRRMRTFSLVRTLFWLALTPIAYFTGWVHSVAFVSLLSLWALVETAFAAWRSDENPDAERLQRMERQLARIEHWQSGWDG